MPTTTNAMTSAETNAVRFWGTFAIEYSAIAEAFTAAVATARLAMPAGVKKSFGDTAIGRALAVPVERNQVRADRWSQTRVGLEGRSRKMPAPLPYRPFVRYRGLR